VVSKGKPTNEHKQQPRERDKVKSGHYPICTEGGEY